MSLLCLHLRPSLKLGDLDTEAGRCMGCLLHSLAEAKNTGPNISPNGRNREREMEEGSSSQRLDIKAI